VAATRTKAAPPCSTSLATHSASITSLLRPGTPFDAGRSATRSLPLAPCTGQIAVTAIKYSSAPKSAMRIVDIATPVTPKERRCRKKKPGKAVGPAGDAPVWCHSARECSVGPGHSARLIGLAPGHRDRDGLGRVTRWWLTDHGVQFTSWAFTHRARASGLVPSVSSIGDCYDNVMIASFWVRMQTELLDAIAGAPGSSRPTRSSSTSRSSTTVSAGTPPSAT